MSKGSVYVGGKDVRDYHLETLRDQVAVVLQKMCCSPARFLRICAGEMKMQQKRNVSKHADRRVQMNL